MLRPNTWNLRQASAADAPAAGAAMAAAFASDPVWKWMINDPRRFERRASRVHQAIVRMHLPLATVWLTTPVASTDEPSPRQRVLSVGVWAPSKQFKVPIHRALAQIPRLATVNRESLRRLGATTELDQCHPDEPHWYLAVIGTRPDCEGRGLGAAVMAPALTQADADGVGCYLESSKEHNVSYYQRHGFEVIGTVDLDRGRGPRLWRMWRDPQPAST
jgi:GNAT superfamily N-acetyltransferase